MDLELKGKVAIVTGAARYGRATAHQLSREGLGSPSSLGTEARSKRRLGESPPRRAAR